MNKKQIDKYIPRAYELLIESGIAENGKVPNTFRAYISSFGAAVIMGSLNAAIAFYSEQGSAKSDRPRLIDIIYSLVSDQPYKKGGGKALISYVEQSKSRTAAKESIYNAALAIKLAISMFTIDKEK